MSKIKTQPGSEKIITTLSSMTVLKGNLKFTKPLKIKGKFEGEIESTGYLFIDEGAQVKADLKVGKISIAGTVRGNITASDSVEVLSTGRVYGNIRTPELRIDDGVYFEGKSEMIKDADSIDVFSASASKIKDTVEWF